MLKLYTFIAGLLLVYTLQAQVPYVLLDTNNIAARVNANGLLFSDADLQRAAFEYPKGLGVHSIYAAALWMAATDVNEQLHAAAGMFGQEQEDFFPGPLTTDGTATKTAEVMEDYNRVWVANKSDVDLHILL
jgi:hypothetical protein